MPWTSKYKPKYAKMLRDGMRKTGLTIAECCIEFGIVRSVWYAWIDKHPKFAEAVELSELHYEAHFARKFRAVANGDEKGNAGMLIFAAKNAMGWADKVETHNTHDEEVKVIQIEMLPPRQDLRLINNVIDITEAKDGEGS